jgi:hypothetical protein
MKNGMASYWVETQRRVEFIFEAFPDTQDDPNAFIRMFEKVFGCGFPFWYARARTEFGIVFGRDLSPEDASWGKYRPVDEVIPPSLDEQIDRMEKQMAECKPSEPATPADQTEIDDLDDEPW